MIARGKDTLLCDMAPAAMPNVGPTLNGWFKPIVLEVITIGRDPKTFQVIETAELINTLGVKQPLSKRRLELKPEGQRAWDWQQLHVTPEVVLEPGMYIRIGGVKYRVMASGNYRDMGYVEYELVNDATRPQ